MGCNASQEPIIVPNENGNIITSSTAVDDDTLNDAEQQQQKLEQSPQPPSAPDQQSHNNQSEPDVSISATNNSNIMRDGSSSISSNGNGNDDVGSGSPDNKTMTPFSSSPLSSAASPPTKRHEKGFVGHKIDSAKGPPLAAPPSIDNGNQEKQHKQNNTGVESPRVQSATTKASSADSSSSTRSGSQKSSATVEKGEESMPGNRLEICSDGASDLANNLANSITETNKEDDSTIEFGNEEGTNTFHGIFLSMSFSLPLFLYFLPLQWIRKGFAIIKSPELVSVEI